MVKGRATVFLAVAVARCVNAALCSAPRRPRSRRIASCSRTATSTSASARYDEAVWPGFSRLFEYISGANRGGADPGGCQHRHRRYRRRMLRRHPARRHPRPRDGESPTPGRWKTTAMVNRYGERLLARRSGAVQLARLQHREQAGVGVSFFISRYRPPPAHQQESCREAVFHRPVIGRRFRPARAIDIPARTGVVARGASSGRRKRVVKQQVELRWGSK